MNNASTSRRVDACRGTSTLVISEFMERLVPSDPGINVPY